MSVRGTATVTVETAISTSLWALWAEIAIEHESAAIGARQELERQLSAGRPHDALGDETKAAMLTIASAAFAVDGLHGVVSKRVVISEADQDKWKANKLSRAGWITETLRRAVRLGRLTNTLPRELKWLFALRDANVHPEEAFTPGADHPLIPRVTAERALYTTEAARRAVTVMLDVLDVATSARALTTEWAEYANNNRARVESLIESRSQNP